MNGLDRAMLSAVLLVAAGCAQMSPSEGARTPPAPAVAGPAAPSPILRGEQVPPLPEQTAPLPPEAGQSDFLEL